MARCVVPKKKKYADSDCYSSSDDNSNYKKKKDKKCKSNNKSYQFLSNLSEKVKQYFEKVPLQRALLTSLLGLTGLIFLAFLWLYRGSFPFLFGESSIERALARYHADRLGIADYALESAGGSVLCSSDTFYSKSGALYSIFGIPIWYHSSSPRAVIQPEVHPGKCWAMHGTNGYVTIQLSMPIIIEAISLEHIPQKVSPTGKLDSAPREFLVMAKHKHRSDQDITIGRFTYDIYGKYVQKFDIKDQYCSKSDDERICSNDGKKIFRIVTLKVISNHGNPDFTCIYRFRVHGRPPMIDEV